MIPVSLVLRRLLRVASAASLLSLGQDDRWVAADPGYRWQFPRDHYAHPSYKTEWWYVTGQVAPEGRPQQRYGYQLTFFRIGVLPARPAFGSDWVSQMLIMGHVAVTDVAGRRHLFSDVLYRATPLLGGFGEPGDSLIAWSKAPAGTSGRWTLAWQDDGFTFSTSDQRRDFGFTLRAAPAAPLVFEGPNGFSRKGPGATSASQYYSFTRLPTTGAIHLGDSVIPVRGESWMDHEIGSNQLTREQVGWDWFGLQLDDHRELMLYLLRDSSGAVTWASGTLVSPGGVTRWLPDTAFSVRGTATWTSDSTHATYPSRWQVRVPSANLDVEVSALVASQENRPAVPRGLFYWEGAVSVTRNDREIGRGYVELTGYGKGLRPAL